MADDRVQQGDEMDEAVVVQENYLMILFRDINPDLITRKINFSAKVYFKEHVRAHKDGNYIRLILVDEGVISSQLRELGWRHWHLAGLV
ncbi:hypothetical protein EJB05_54736 [Eragrostis curvula]|uniref:Uncharacterized protein n=1 Tax=Eragrostis curvula TaxID=38414 RepID=A0A5J9SLL3_9POAL|nr:hypothetical protein EJB05_54736 [Eragrostis curvula]